MGAALGGRRAPTASTGPRSRERRSTRSTLRRPRSSGRCTSATSSPTPTPTSSPATSACAATSVFYPMGWDDNGLPTERRVQNYYGVRCDPTLPYDAGFRRRAGRAPRKNQGGRPAADLAGATSSSCASELDRRGREGLRGRCGGTLGPVGGLDADLPDHRRPVAGPIAQRAFLRNLARGEAYQAEAPTLWDVTFRTAVAQAELEDRDVPGRLPPARLPRPPTATRSSSRPPAPSCSPPASPSSPTPTTSATSRCSARRSRTPLFGVEVPVVAHPLAEPDKGSGIAMICTFGDLTDVTWWRELQLPTRADRRPGRPHPRRDPRVDRPRGRPRPLRAELAGKTVVQRQGSAWSSCCATSGDLRRRARADHAPGEVLREGRQAPRDRHHPPVVHPQRRPRRGPARRAARPRRRARRSTPPSCASATRTGSRASTATG